MDKYPMKGVTLYKALMNPSRSKYHIRNTSKTLRGLCGCEISVVNLSHTFMVYRDDCDSDVCKRCFEKWWKDWQAANPA